MLLVNITVYLCSGHLSGDTGIQCWCWSPTRRQCCVNNYKQEIKQVEIPLLVNKVKMHILKTNAIKVCHMQCTGMQCYLDHQGEAYCQLLLLVRQSPLTVSIEASLHLAVVSVVMTFMLLSDSSLALFYSTSMKTWDNKQH